MTAALVFNSIIFNAISFHGIGLNAIAKTSAVQIVDCLVEGTLIAIFAGLMLSVIRQKNSGTRFAVWFSTLMAIAALPLFGGSWWSHASNISADRAGSAITVPGSWALYAFGAWAAIAAWFLLGVGRGLWHLHMLRNRCLPVDLAEIDSRLLETLAKESLDEAGHSLYLRSGAGSNCHRLFETRNRSPWLGDAGTLGGRIEPDPAA